MTLQRRPPSTPRSLILVFVAALACNQGAAPPEYNPLQPTAISRTPAMASSHESPGLVPINDQPWDGVMGNGWRYLRRASSKDAQVIADATAPFSPPNVLRIVFTPDMRRDHEPSVHWMSLPNVREAYSAWWIKLSANWKASPAGGGKIAFLWAPSGQGQVYSNIGGAGAPHRININTEWAPYGQKFWEPNVTMTPVDYDRWYRIEWYTKWESARGAGDGVMRWWVDGALNGDYRDVRFPGCCFLQFEFAPTLQVPPSAEQHMYIDHTYVSAR